MVKKRGKVRLGDVTGYLLYRSDWITGKQVARDLRLIADLIEKDKDTEWFLLPLDNKGKIIWSEGNEFNYIITPS